MTKTIFLATLALGLTVSAKGRSSCTDVPVTFTIAYYPSGTPGLSSDNLGAYANGGGGVKNAILNCNGESAELSVDAVNRNVYLNLGAPGALVNGTDPLPNPAPISFFNIPFGNFFYNAQPQSTTYNFTTYLKLNMAASGYYFDMQNPAANAPLQPPGSGINTPCNTTLVNVSHTPASGSTPETWVVTPDSSSETCQGQNVTDVGTLTIPPAGKHGSGTSAQFQAPFSITITRQ